MNTAITYTFYYITNEHCNNTYLLRLTISSEQALPGFSLVIETLPSRSLWRESTPIPFRLASHFKTLNGIEVFDNGTLIVSDMVGNKIFTVSFDRQTVGKLLDISGPADTGLNRSDSLLYIPQTNNSEVRAYEIMKKMVGSEHKKRR